MARQNNTFRLSDALIFSSFIWLPASGHLAAWVGLESRHDRWAWTLDSHLWVAMASLPLLVLPAFLIACVLVILDFFYPVKREIWLGVLAFCFVAIVVGGLIVGPMLDL